MDKKKIEAFLDEQIKKEEKSQSFVKYLYVLMRKYKYDNPANLYNKAGISRQLFSSIISEKSQPSLNVCVKLVLAMGVSNAECKLLLKKAGFTLSSSSKYSLLIRYCVENRIYDFTEVNEILSEYGFDDQLLY